MIITKTPFRVSFAGGGSDFRPYYEKYGGAVLSVTINKYIYLSIHPYFFENGYFLKYSKTENVNHVNDIQHPIIRNLFKRYEITGVDFNSSADIPSGTGLASSSAFTVGLINLCNAYTGKYMNKTDIADLACKVEIDDLGDPIGKQDQYACACGGLNFIEFHKNDTVSVEKVCLPPDFYRVLEKNIMIFYIGGSRDSRQVLFEQKKNISQDQKRVESIHKMTQLAVDLKKELLLGNLQNMGEILHQNWMYKKELACGISNDNIDSHYETARANGALGGKLLGAGKNGFLLFYVEEQFQSKVRKALNDLKELNFKFENVGTSVIYYQ